MAFGHTLLSSYVEGVGPGDVGDTLTYEGRKLQRLDSPHNRRHVSVFGELAISRYVHGTRETQKHEVIPADALLGFPDREFSHLLQDWDQSFGVQDAYAESRRKAKRILGINQSVRSLEQMSVSMAEGVSRDGRKPDRPEPCHKQLRAELTREIDGVEVNAKEQIFSWFSEQVKLRNPKGRKKVVCVMDGERALWKMLLASVSGVVCILDLFHVLERLWQAAHCFHAKGSDAAREFVSDRLSETEPAVHVL